MSISCRKKTPKFARQNSANKIGSKSLFVVPNFSSRIWDEMSGHQRFLHSHLMIFEINVSWIGYVSKQGSFRGKCGWIPLTLDCFGWTNWTNESIKEIQSIIWRIDSTHSGPMLLLSQIRFEWCFHHAGQRSVSGNFFRFHDSMICQILPGKIEQNKSTPGLCSYYDVT